MTMMSATVRRLGRHVSTLAARWSEHGMQWLWPSDCAVCQGTITGVGNHPICRDCWETAPKLKRPWCPRCGLPFRSAAALAQSPDHWCAACRERSPSYDCARAAVAYDGVVAVAIKLFKYQQRQRLATPLAAWLFPLLDDLAGGVDGVVPVPLHPRRLREREFNQALALAQVVARQSGWPLWWNVLERKRPTPAQVGLEAVARRRNVRGAFALRRPASVEGKRLMLIDDVLTTGSTVNECARVLKRAGAVSVDVLTVARLVVT